MTFCVINLTMNLLTTSFLGQAAPPPPDAPPAMPWDRLYRLMVTRFVPLKHVECTEAARVAGETFEGYIHSVVASPETNSLVIRGIPEQVEAVLQFIAELEGKTADGSEQSLELLTVRSYPLESLASLIEESMFGLAGGDLHIGIDHVNRKLILSGNAGRLAMARKMVEQVDQPVQSLTVNLFFLRGQIGDGSGGGDLPPALRPVAETLAKNGFGRPSLLAPFTLRADSSREFQSSTLSRPASGDKEGGETLRLEVQGTVQATAGEAVQLQIKASMKSISERNPSLASIPEDFELETALSLALNRYVILAVAPSSTQVGSAVALVVQVTRD